MVEPEQFWSKMPTKRSETYRHLPMEAAGQRGGADQSS